MPTTCLHYMHVCVYVFVGVRNRVLQCAYVGEKAASTFLSLPSTLRWGLLAILYACELCGVTLSASHITLGVLGLGYGPSLK